MLTPLLVWTLLGAGPGFAPEPELPTSAPAADPADRTDRLRAADRAVTPSTEHRPSRRPIGTSAWPASVSRRPELRACLELLVNEQHALAAHCYRQASRRLGASEQQRAQALARLAEDIHRVSDGEPTTGAAALEAPNAPGVASGQAGVVESVGFVLVSMTYGGWLGALLGSYAPELTGLPALGGAMLGLAVSLPPLVLVDSVAAGDLALLRSGMLAGSVHALLGSMALADAGLSGDAVPVAMFGVSALGLGLAGLAVPFVDLPAAGVSLASSAALWGGGMTMLALLSLEQPPGPWLAYASVAGVHDLLLLGGLLVAPWLPVQHSEVWLLNGGAALGLLGGWALGSAVPGPAALDLGLELSGLVLGGGLGYLAGGLVHDELEAAGLSELSPLLGWQRLARGVDDPHAERVLMAGLQLRY